MSKPGIEQTLQHFLHEQLAGKAVGRLVLGFSGGLDSSVLLHALAHWHKTAVVPVDLLALHVHHGLSPHADAWATQAQETAGALGISCMVQRVAVGQGASLEAEARKARHAAFAECLRPGDALLLAQHQDDQAETVLFRLLRGAGVRGLGAMQANSLLDGIPRWRPLLGISRQALEQYAAAHSLRWVEDESNTDTRYARNFLRQRIIPELRTHWPEAGKTLAATAHRMQEADALLGEYAQLLLAPLRLHPAHPGESPPVSVGGLLALSAAQRKLLLRTLVQEQGLPLPEEKILDQIERDVLPAAADAGPVVRWPGGECRRYRDGLYMLAALPEIPANWESPWAGAPLILPDGRTLTADSWPWAGKSVVVRYRRGGEKIKPAGSAHTRELKTLMQEAGMPPWQRERVALVFVEDELLVVLGLCATDMAVRMNGMQLH
jgi:tRNA(Ile)-lysidine synthase